VEIMIVTRLILKNWRNFRDANVPLRDRTYLVGANASGKSNFLDAFRFLRDISKPAGGGIQKAVEDRGGMSKLRCLHARNDPEVCIEVHVSESADDEKPTWRYLLGFKSEGKGAHRLLVSKEKVWRNGIEILSRPLRDDEVDQARLTQTHLEQIQTNSKFRELADFFGDVTYLHLVPQLLKFGDRIGGNRLENDPFGQGFLERIAKCSKKTRDVRLTRIEKALALAVPRFKQLQFAQDENTGRPHLEAMYEHHRPHAGWQREEQFSDGTLRLIALLWTLLDGESLLLLEEPELSLHNAIVEQIPRMIQHVQRSTKRRRQIVISSHSEVMLSNPGIDGRGVLVLEPSAEGTHIRVLDESEKSGLNAGLSIAEVVMPKTRPESAKQLALW
jgi:predicted ATPase